MQTIVINRRFGGFGLSAIGQAEYKARTGMDVSGTVEFITRGGIPIWLTTDDIDRTCPALVAMVTEDSGLYSGRSAELGIVEIPDGVSWHVSSYDGLEHVAEDHRTWY